MCPFRGRYHIAITTDSGTRDLLKTLTGDPQLKVLEKIPLVPPVNLGLTFGVWLVFLASTAAYLYGWLPLAITIPLSAMAIYAAFTPLHDATHRAVSSNPIINDFIGTLAATLLVPCMTTGIYRVLHLEHHRWAGDIERDPDTPLVHTRKPWLFFALGAPDVVWAWWWATRLWSQRNRRERLAFFSAFGLHFVLLTAVLLSAYGWTFVVVYLIPQKIGIFMVAYSFAHIQHPENVNWKTAPLLATGAAAPPPRSHDLASSGKTTIISTTCCPYPWHRYRHVWTLGNGILKEQRSLSVAFRDTMNRSSPTPASVSTPV